jgi:hypothetical protein
LGQPTGLRKNYVAATFTELLEKTKNNFQNNIPEDLNGIKLNDYLNNFLGCDSRRIIHKFRGF